MLRTIAFAAAFALGASSVQAAEIKVMVSGAMAHALEEISHDFAQKNGHTIDFIVGTTGMLQQRVRGGERVDVIEVTNVGMDALVQERLVAPETRVEMARAMLAIAVPANADAPDISTPEALRQRLLAARSVAHIDPVIGGVAGAGILNMLRQLNVADEVARKTVHGRTGAESVQKMIDGEADIAITYVSEILPNPRAKLVGQVPAAVQNASSYSGAVGAMSAQPEIARALLAAMVAAENAHVIREAGLEPVASH